ncbi:c-type cytochrome [Massilia soli]|nr:c-type cytochrome [Massilia soli]
MRIGLTLGMVLALASSAAAANGQRLYASCAACHGTNGAGAGNALPVLAGQPKDALVASMRAFKTGARPATIMHQISKGYTDKQIEEIAVYLSRQKP